MFWVDNIDPFDDVGEAWVANPDNCAARRQWTTGMDFWFLRGSDAILFTDSGSFETATLKYVQINGTTLGTPVEIQRQVERVYGVLPGFEAVLFNLIGGQFKGLYAYKKVPAGTVTADAGAPRDSSAPDEAATDVSTGPDATLPDDASGDVSPGQ